MKTIKNIFIVVLLVAGLTACKQEATPEVKTIEIAQEETKKELDPNATYAKAEFNIEGMTCAVGCAAKIEKTMANMDGVKFAKVDFEKKLAMVEYNIDEVSPDKLSATVAKAGDYKTENMQTVENFSEE